MIFAGSLQAPMTPRMPAVRMRIQMFEPGVKPLRLALPPLKRPTVFQFVSVFGSLGVSLHFVHARLAIGTPTHQHGAADVAVAQDHVGRRRRRRGIGGFWGKRWRFSGKR